MSVFAAHVRYRTLDYARTPFAVGPTLAFPSMVTAFFLLPNLPSDEAPRGPAIVLLVTFTMVTIFIFGAGIAQERHLPWEAFLRTLPLRASTALGANLLVGLAFGMLGALPAIGLLVWRLDVTIPLMRWLTLVAAVLLGTAAMGGIGLTIGYALPAKAAIATANLVFLPMAFVGGLLLPPEILPDWAATIGWATPMRPWVELSFATAEGGPVEGWLWLLLVAWAAALCAVAGWAYRRDQVRRYR